MGFLTWICKIQNAIHKYAESTRSTEEGKRNQELPPNGPVKVSAVVSYSDETIRNAKAQADREYSNQTSIKNATWFAFVAASIYALIAGYQGCQMRMATQQVTRQINDFEASQRANLVIEQPIPIMPIDKSAAIKVPCLVRNVGATTAANVSIGRMGGGGLTSDGTLSFPLYIGPPSRNDTGGPSLAARETADCSESIDPLNDEIRGGKRYMYTVATVSYRDVFGHFWVVDACLTYYARRNTFLTCEVRHEK